MYGWLAFVIGGDIVRDYPERMSTSKLILGIVLLITATAVCGGGIYAIL